MITRSGVAGVGFLASLFLYRLLGPEEAGKFQLLIAVTATAGTAMNLGLYETLARFVPERSPESGAGLFRRGVHFNVYAFLFSLVLFGGLLILGLVPAELRIAPIAVIVTTAAYAFQATALGMLRGQGRLNVIPWLEMARNFGGRIAALVVAVALVASFATAFRAYAAIQLVVLVFTFYFLRRAFSVSEGRFTATETRVARLLLLGEMLGILILVADIYLLRILMDAHDVGIYAAGVRPTRIGKQMVLGPLMVPLLYYFSHPESAYLKDRIVAKGTRIAGVLMGVMGMAMILLAEPLVRIVLGDQFAESIPVLQIYIAYAMGHGMTMFFFPFFNSVNRPQYGIYLKLVTLLLSGTLALVLIPRYGVVGAAVGGVLGMSFTILLAAIFLRLRFDIRILWVVLRLFALYGACFWLGRMVSPVLGLGVFLALLYPLGLVRSDDFRLLKELRRGARKKKAEEADRAP